MKVFGFTNNAGYIGGSGVVIAPDKETALQMVNEIGKVHPLKFQCTEDELIEVEENSVTVLTSGDY